MFLKWMAFVFVGVISSATAAPAPVAAAPPAALSAADILAKVVIRDKQLQVRRKAFDYDLDITREKLDDTKAVLETTREHSVVIGDHRPDYNTRGTPGSPADEAKEASREEPFSFLDMLDHYTYALEADDVINGVPCYKIAFTPKDNMPYENREEKVLNAVAGHIWVSKKDYSLLRDEGSLLHPVSVAWVFASLREMEFHFDAMVLPNGDYGPKQVQYRYLVGIPFGTLHERDTRAMSKYRLTHAAMGKT